MNRKLLWPHVKKTAAGNEIQKRALIFAGAFLENRQIANQFPLSSNENEPEVWHFDRAQNRTVKRITRPNCLVHAAELPLPIAFDKFGKPCLSECGQSKCEATCPKGLECQQQAITEFVHLRPLRCKYQTIRTNKPLDKNQAQLAGTETIDVIASIYASFRLECLTIKNKINEIVQCAKSCFKVVGLVFVE
jgi:hypothetical protein